MWSLEGRGKRKKYGQLSPSRRRKKRGAVASAPSKRRGGGGAIAKPFSKTTEFKKGGGRKFLPLTTGEKRKKRGRGKI